MCTNYECELVALPTSSTTCPRCGAKNSPWATDTANELRRRASAYRVRQRLRVPSHLTEEAQSPPPPEDLSTSASVLVVTTNDVPGWRVTAVYGDVFGIDVRTRNMISDMGSQLRTIVGGEVGGYLKLLSMSRVTARERLKEAARKVGANAVIAMRFDANEFANVMTEIVAYGTAVTIVPIEEASRPEDRPLPHVD